jgi:hypothetical protein
MCLCVCVYVCGAADLVHSLTVHTPGWGAERLLHLRAAVLSSIDALPQRSPVAVLNVLHTLAVRSSLLSAL